MKVGYPTSPGHEILGSLFKRLSKNTDSYPPGPYNGSEIISCGTASVKLADGVKQPDYSLYERRQGTGPMAAEAHALNAVPTITWEVGYSESPEKLALDAARMICLSKGLIQLVVTINITSEIQNTDRVGGKRKVEEEELPRVRALEGVTCAFWEMDFNAFNEVPSYSGRLNKLVPSHQHHTQPPTSFPTTVSMDSKKYTVKAMQTLSHQIHRLLVSLCACMADILN